MSNTTTADDPKSTTVVAQIIIVMNQHLIAMIGIVSENLIFTALIQTPI